MERQAAEEGFQAFHTEELNGKAPVPGTERLLDAEGCHDSVRSNVALIPTPHPSNDPCDPLNWSPFWKASATISLSLVSFAQGFGPLAIAPMLPQLAEDFHSDLAGVVQFTGVSILVLGFSNFIWNPVSSAFGRRPVLLFSTLLALGSSIWKAKASTYGGFMGACVLNGIGAGPGETLQPQSTTDFVFLHERGRYNILYFVCYYGSSTFSPIVAGLMAEHSDWRNFWWLNVAIAGAALMISLFAFPETKWDRPCTPTAVPQVSTDQKPQTADPPKPKSRLLSEGSTLRNGRPRKDQFGLFHPSRQPLQVVLMEIWLPFKLAAYPIVDFASLVVAWSSSSALVVNLTQAQAFAAPPYSYTAQSIGLFNFALVIGPLLGLVSAGPMIDWICMQATKRNNGIREPEMRLPAMIPYTLIMVLGNFVVGFGYQYHWSWKAIVILGYTCAGIQGAALSSIVSTYAIDSYKPVTGSIFVQITVVKNLWGYGMSRFLTNWSTADGFVAPIMMNMSLTALWCLCGVLFWYKGKVFRTWTSKSEVHNM